MLRKLRRPKWLVAVVGGAVLAPVIFLVSGVTAAGNGPVKPATPLVDRDYIYGQLFNMSYSDVYRVSGADGDPRNANDPFNLPPTVNGWQEFVQHWKQQLTDKKQMTDLAKFATVSDHYFRRMDEQRTNPNYSFDTAYRWDSDDVEVTIPGATCPGTRVLLAAHPDGTPVTPAIVGEVNNPQLSTSSVFGFGAARRHITLSNLANGGAYDDTSGVALTMGEYQALLRWYDANHTYPSKTLKVALLDASAGLAKDGTYLREGSKYYANNLIPEGPQGQYAMFAEMNANGMSYPAYHLGTQYFWNNLAGGGVGPWRTFITDTPSAPNAVYADTGPGSAGANIAANSAAIAQFHTSLTGAVTAGFAQQSAKYNGAVPQENPLRYNGTGSAPGGLSTANGGPQLPQTPSVPAYTATEQAQYSPVHPAGTAAEAQILSTEDDAAAFWNLGIPGFSVGGVQDSNIDENPYTSAVSAAIRSTPVLQYTGGGTAFEFASGVPAGGMSTLTAATAVGATQVTVTTGSNFVGRPAVLHRHGLEPGGRQHRGGQRQHRDADRAAQARPREWFPIPRERGPAGRVHGRHARAPELLRVGRAARNRRRDFADRGASPRARAARDLHGAARQRERLPRRDTGAEGRGRVLRDRSGEADVDPDGHVRREVRPERQGRHRRAEVLLGLRRRHDRRRQDGDAHLRVADVGRREACRGAGRQDRQVGPLPTGRRSPQPVRLGPVDARVRDVLRGRARLALSSGGCGVQGEASSA